MKLSEYAKKNGICYRTAHRYWKQGLLKGKQLETGTILIDEKENNMVEWVIYSRVSSHDQKEDLERQVKRLEDFASAKGLIINQSFKEIASGVNDKRPKLMRALSSKANIIVEHKDRLTRFGFNYLEVLMREQGREILVINEASNEIDDLMQDFIAIITSFCARLYGKRRQKRKTEKIIKELNS